MRTCAASFSCVEVVGDVDVEAFAVEDGDDVDSESIDVLHKADVETSGIEVEDVDSD